MIVIKILFIHLNRLVDVFENDTFSAKNNTLFLTYQV